MADSESTLVSDLKSRPAPGSIDMANSNRLSPGALIINADDWGLDVETTDRILECIMAGTVSSTSAMVFMADSHRAARLAKERGIDAGLHLNFTTPFSQPNCEARLKEHQAQVIRYLRGSRLAQVVYHPGLVSSFEYVAKAQLEEYEKLFGAAPRRVDGHHHMHLCANVLFGKLLPPGTIARRNFSFAPGEKSHLNRLYRTTVDRVLARRHEVTDYFYSLPPLEPVSRVDEIFRIAQKTIVELETHPANPSEYMFLTSGEILRRTSGLQIARNFPSPSELRKAVVPEDCR